MMVPLILRSDKTLASNATGQNEFHPLYISPGNVKGSVRRAHCDAVIPIGFLAIPKSECVVPQAVPGSHTVSGSRKDGRSVMFRSFRRQLIHESLKAILRPLHPYTSKPDIVICPDRHYRRAVYALGPYIADYPEQVIMAGVVNGWCVWCVPPLYVHFHVSPGFSVAPPPPPTLTDLTPYCGLRSTPMHARRHSTPRWCGKNTG